MNFNAQLDGLTLPHILQIITLGKLSGVATVIHNWTTGKLVFAAGQVVYASSDTQSRLGYTLIKKRVISEQDLTRALATQKTQAERMPLATLLVAKGYVDSETLEEQTKAHIKKVFSDILSWPDGVFHFKPAEISDKLRILENGLSTEALLIEAAASQDDAQRASKEDDSVEIDCEICDFT